MAMISVGKHFRAIRRAVRTARRRQIKPGLALLLIARNSWRLFHAIVFVALLLAIAAVVLSIRCSGAAVRKVRGYGGIARGKMG